MIPSRAVIVLLSWLIGQAAATPFEKHTVTVELRDPRGSFEANAHLWEALNYGFSRAWKIADERLKLSPSLGPRLFLLGASLWSNSMLRYYSHEIAHEYIYQANEFKLSGKPNFSRWTSSYLPIFYYPRWEKQPNDLRKYDDDQLLFAVTAGLNQDEWNARTLWRRELDEKSGYYSAAGYLLTKFRDVAYLLTAGSEERPFASGQSLAQLSQRIYLEAPNLYDDVNLYRLAMLNKGITVTNAELLRQNLAADLLSAKTWESLYALTRFALYGDQRGIRLPLQFHVGYYLSSNGGFYQAEFPFQVFSRRAILSLGKPAGSRNSFHNLRLGIESYSIPIGANLQLAPFGFWTFSEQNPGGAVGAQIQVCSCRRFIPWIHISFAKNDMLENRIKGEKNGFELKLGLSKIFQD
ncbi:MAG: hypothetical protein ONB24_10630 [candidate division KSB1 bacterium]|nr:hypothetical protein [candidate division KSB1 bacterium]